MSPYKTNSKTAGYFQLLGDPTPNASADGERAGLDVDNIKIKVEPGVDVKSTISIRQKCTLLNSENLNEVMARIEKYRKQRGSRPMDDKEYLVYQEARLLGDAIDNEVTTIEEFTRDLNKQRFPEMETLMMLSLHYFKTVKELGNHLSNEVNYRKLAKFLSESTVKIIFEMMSKTNEHVLSENDLFQISEACDMGVKLIEFKTKIDTYLNSREDYIPLGVDDITDAMVDTHVNSREDCIPLNVDEITDSRIATELMDTAEEDSSEIYSCLPVRKPILNTWTIKVDIDEEKEAVSVLPWEEGNMYDGDLPQNCPKCHVGLLRWFQYSYHESIYMCNNIPCDYPFGKEGDIVTDRMNDDTAKIQAMLELTDTPQSDMNETLDLEVRDYERLFNCTEAKLERSGSDEDDMNCSDDEVEVISKEEQLKSFKLAHQYDNKDMEHLKLAKLIIDKGSCKLVQTWG